MFKHNLKFSAVLPWLGLAFGVSLVLTVGIGLMNLRQMGKMNAEVQRVTETQWPSFELAQQALKLSNRNNRITLQLFMISDEHGIEGLLKEMRQNSDQIGALLQQIEGLASTDEERQLIVAIVQTRRPYRESYKTVLDLLLHESKRAEAQQMMLTVTLPRLVAYHEAWEKFEAYQGDAVAKSSATVEALYKRWYKRSPIFFFFGTLLAVGIFGLVGAQLRQKDILVTRSKTELENAKRALKRHTNPGAIEDSHFSDHHR